MGVEAFARALDGGADVVIAGRACDTAIFAACPADARLPDGALHAHGEDHRMHVHLLHAGRTRHDRRLSRDESFVLDSMNPERHATPTSVAAHSLYEQADPFSVAEPEGVLRLEDARYEALDGHRTRVYGARWEEAACLRVKVEGALLEGQRAVLLAGSVDPQVIHRIDEILNGRGGHDAQLVRTFLPHLSTRLWPTRRESLAAGRRGDSPRRNLSRRRMRG